MVLALGVPFEATMENKNIYLKQTVKNSRVQESTYYSKEMGKFLYETSLVEIFQGS